MLHDRKICISVGASRKSTDWKRQSLLLSELYERLRIPARGPETLSRYLSLRKPEQDDLKDVGGFVAGTLNGSRRKAGAVTGRDVLTLDLDNIPAGETDDILRRVEGLGCGYCVYSTRKHAPEAPRLRILLPLDRTASADEYEPCARRMADYIGITLADPTTFEASRLMYWPSCCADSEYVYLYQDKPLLSVDGLLATYADWRDYTSWPQVPGAQSPAKLAAKQGDPLTKKGVVGAFCRAYDIEAAMDAYLPGVYAAVDGADNRFTYAGGSTTGGAVLYDDGKFLFSHHATDPCSGKLVNAFDLVRLHRFGALDDSDDVAPGTPTVRLPSYTAMTELAVSDSKVSALLLEERYAEATGVFTPVSEDAPEMPKLRLTSQGTPEKSLANLQLLLETGPQFRGKLRKNLFSGRVDVVGELPWQRPGNAATWNDDDDAQLRIYLEPIFGKVSKNDITDAVSACANNQAYHPVRDYLSGLTWDGVGRLDALFIDYLGAEDCPYVRAVTRKAFVAAVARIMRPGCKYDTMPVLIGGQGRHKSSILSVMGGEWFSDSLRTFEGKDAMETIQGTWINEVAELQAMHKADVDAVKAFLTKTHDYYRAAYGKHTADRARQCVFFGTTNSRECLTDNTGGRRFWPVDIDVRQRRKNVFSDLPKERDQMWAEAVELWRRGEPLHLPAEIETVARVVQEEHRQRHPWEGLIFDFLARPIPEDWSNWGLDQRRMFLSGTAQFSGNLVPRQRVCAVEIWCEMLGKFKSDMRKSDSHCINGILEHLPDWESVGVRSAGKDYGKQRCFERQQTPEN